MTVLGRLKAVGDSDFDVGGEVDLRWLHLVDNVNGIGALLSYVR